jgi:Uma2 family endonuclease
VLCKQFRLMSLKTTWNGMSEPDVTVLHSSFRDLNGNPQPSNIALAVEIADTSLRQDLTAKAGLYARAGIAEYWVVNLKHRRLHVFREPSAGVYSARFEVGETDAVSPLAQPTCSIAVATLLG